MASDDTNVHDYETVGWSILEEMVDGDFSISLKRNSKAIKTLADGSSVKVTK